MKRVVFLFALCALQIIECNSFDFRRLFESSSVPVSSPSSKDLSSMPKKLFENEDKEENVSLSLNEDIDLEHNISISASDGYVENATLDSNRRIEKSEVNNLTNEVLNIPDSQPELSKVHAVSKIESSTSVPSSTEGSTEDGPTTSTSPSTSNNASSLTEEPEAAVLNTNSSGTFTFITETMYKKTIAWMGDAYTLSILVPVAAGVLFALTIIVTIATCRCIKRKCRRRRFRKRVLPDSIKNLRPADQARLLGDCCDSSDEF